MQWQLIIITGASKGFGKAIAEQYSELSKAPTHYKLVGRDEDALQTTKQGIEQARNSPDTTVVDIINADLGDILNLKELARTLFAVPSETRTYFKVVLLNNAGSLGPLANIGTYAGDMLQDITLAFNLNVTSSCYLTADLMRCAQLNGSYASNGIRKVVIVNISSLAAVQPFGSWGVYCAGKAAREMFHRCLTEEVGKRGTSDVPAVRILNYAPGPLDTNMQTEIRDGPSVDKDTQQFYRELKERNQLVSPGASATKLIKIILNEKFETGAHIDFYDATSELESTESTTCCKCPQCACGVDCFCSSLSKPQCPACANGK